MICRHCQIDKPESDFPKIKSWCTACHRVATNKSKEKNIDKYKQYHKDYYANWYKKNGRKRDTVKGAAHTLVYRAIRSGVLKRPNRCEYCKAVGRVEAHHDNYFEPLAVLWLCNRCHRNRHLGERVA